MPYESAFLSQAELGKGPDSTLFERKSMSTNKTLKRIALVAVASLGFGLVSVAPSNAADLDWTVNTAYANAGTAAARTATQIAGANNYVTATLTVTAATNYAVAVSGGTASTDDTVSGQGTANLVVNGGAADTDVVFTIPTPTVGTITVSTYTLTGGAQAATATSTLTITVVAAGLSGVASSTYSTSIVDGSADDNADSTAAFGDAAADVKVTASNQIGAAQAAAIVVAVKDGLDAAINASALSATIEGPGLLGINADATAVTTAATGRAVSVTSTGANDSAAVVTVWADQTGVGGTGTVKIYTGTTLLATETVTFYGNVAKLTATQLLYSVDDDAASVSVVKITGTDANGVAVPVQAADGAVVETATSLSVTAIADANNGATAVDVTVDAADAKYGVKSFTWKHTSTALTVTGSVVVSENTAEKVTISFDKATYTPGELMTVTVSAVDVNGNQVADGNRLLLKNDVGIIANVSLVASTLPTDETIALVNGKASYTAYAPLVSGPLTLTATEGTDTNSTTKGSITASASVGATPAEEAAAAAADAAAEAIDAANAATDAANLAAEAADAATVAAEEARDAADAATAAVEELATQVATLMAALKAQLTTLANTVAKIAKKVRA